VGPGAHPTDGRNGLNDLIGRDERWLPVEVQLREPLPDVAMEGYSALHVTVMSGATPVGRVVVPCRAAICSSARLHTYVQDFARYANGIELSERFEQPPQTNRAVSVIVCTRNRAAQLADCLSALAALELVDAQIIVVDNGDDEGATERTAHQYRADYVAEPVAGLDRARNRGLTIARHHLVLFTDDDVTVDPKWAYWLAGAFDDPTVAAATGMILPAELETPGQVEFEVLAGFVRTVRSFTLDGSYTPPAAAGRAGAGASMAFRRDFIVGLGGFPEVLDGGRPTKSGGDTYGLYLALRNGQRVRFEPRSIAHHHHRRNRDDSIDTVAGYATGVVSYLLLAAGTTRDPSALVAATKWAVWRTGLLVRQGITDPRSISTKYLCAQVRGAFAGPRALLRAHQTNTTTAVLGAGIASRPCGEHPAVPPIERASADMGSMVSVVIPTQGQRPGLVALVAELRRRHGSDRLIEIILATDGPFRDAAHLFSHLGSEIDARVVLGSGGGAGAARNRGAAAASGELLLFLDDDIRLDPSDEKSLDIDVIAAHQRAHANGCVAVVGPILPLVQPSRSTRPSALAMMELNWWSDQARHLADGRRLGFTDLCSGNFSIQREVFAELGGFTELARREDYELGLRLIDAGYALGCALEATVWHPSDGTVGGAMMRRRREGRADISLAEDHPLSVTKLDLWSWPDLAHRRQQLAHGAIEYPRVALGIAAIIAQAVPVLERLGSRNRLARVLDLIIDTAYWAGVGEATNGFAGWRRQSSKIAAALDAAPHDHLDLHDVESWDPQPHGHHLVDVMRGEERVGTADLRWGGLPFNRASFAERLASDLGVRVGSPTNYRFCHAGHSPGFE
jgi:O-antigen biosynthesis protein